MREGLSHSHGYDHEHEVEPQYGLPEELPASERILWQGSPNWMSLARHGFHTRKLLVYFALIIAARVFVVLTDGGGTSAAVVSALWLSLLAAIAIGIMAGVAYLSARTTVYTITTRRVVMRVGIVITLTFNLPFKRIAAAGMRELSGNTGDIPLTLASNDKIAYAHLWPHARPWRFAKPEPMLRSITNPVAVAELLTKAWRECTGSSVAASASPLQPADMSAGVQATTGQASASGATQRSMGIA